MPILTRTTAVNNLPEIELLLCCSRTSIEPETAKRIEVLLQQDINWQFLLKTATNHEVLPLLYQSLKHTNSEAVPKDLLSVLHNYFHCNAQRNCLLTGELLNIIKLFEENKIFAIPFKGSILAISVYQNLALRQFGDLDILLDQNDIAKATKLLSKIGYEMPRSLLKREETSYRQDRRFLESDNYQKGYDFINHKIRVAIDLQWSLTEKRKSQFFPLSFQQLKANTKTIAIAGTDVPIFSLDDRLLYLCFHGSKHCWSSLKWICDVAELIRVHPEINWQNVEKKAKILGCSRMLWLGLFLAHDLLQTPLPAIVLEKMQADTQAYVLFQKVRQLIFTRPFTQLEKYFFILQLTDSLKGKWEFLSSLLFTPSVPEWEFLPLPKSVSFLYYLIRPMRLIWKYLRVVI